MAHKSSIEGIRDPRAMRFDKDTAGGLLVGYFDEMGFVVFTSIGVPVSASWWIVPGTAVEDYDGATLAIEDDEETFADDCAAREQAEYDCEH